MNATEFLAFAKEKLRPGCEANLDLLLQLAEAAQGAQGEPDRPTLDERFVVALEAIAFPQIVSDADGIRPLGWPSRRDMFAMAALLGMYNDPKNNGNPVNMAKCAAIAAEEMVKNLP